MINIIIFGAPGSGKGTQGVKIAEKYGLEHVSTGDMLRKEVKSNSEVGKKLDSFMSKGQLIPDALMIEMLENMISNKTDAKGFIFDGFPRTLAQGKALDEMLQKHGEKVSVVLSLEVEEEELVNRILKRGEISGRADDNKETVAARLKVYHENTEPLKTFYADQFKLVRIHGEGDIEDIFSSIVDVIDRIAE
ncbi:MAG: adenylate kinase [Fermentimonas sp.]|jgi:adenylate kinase